MNLSRSNIILIGMAGSGKSTVGRMLAHTLSRPFIDTDILVRQAVGCPLQEVIDIQGPMEFRRIEENILLAVNVADHVIATGGSSIYSSSGMMHLKRDGIVVLLEVELAVLEDRVRDLDTRGLVKRPEQSFAELYEERLPLYRKYADISVACGTMNRHEVCRAVTANIPPSLSH